MKLISWTINFIKNILNKYEPIISKVSNDNIFAIAGQSAFFIVLSSVPLTIFIVSLLQNFHISIELVENTIGSIFSDKVTNEISVFLSGIYQNTVGISLVSLIVTLWSAAQGIHAITNGLNRIYDTYENRNYFFLRIRAMMYTVAFFAIILLSFVVIVLGKTINEFIAQYLPNLPDFVALAYHLRYVIIFLGLTLLFATIFRNFPNIDKEKRKEYCLKYQLPGAFLCTTSWYVLSFGISIYVDDFNGFSVYGGLTKLAIVMIWLYFCMVCLMICAEINFIYHDKIKKFSLKRFIKDYI